MANNITIESFFESKEFLSPIQSYLIKALRQNGSLSRRELVNKLNIPRTTIYDNLLKLQKRRIVEKFIRNNGKRGRPLVFWKLGE